MNPVSLRTLLGAFVRLGATAYGGPAMMATLRQECVGRRHWLTEQDFKEGMALCQLIPGATMMQMATYIGYRLRGVSGATAAAVTSSGSLPLKPWRALIHRRVLRHRRDCVTGLLLRLLRFHGLGRAPTGTAAPNSRWHTACISQELTRRRIRAPVQTLESDAASIRYG